MPRQYTIQDLQAQYYGMHQSYFVTKTDDPWLSTTTGAFNAIYGSYFWTLINLESNIFGVIPKVPWDYSGVRLINGKVTSIAGAGDTYGGTDDTGAVADSVKPPMGVYDSKPKLMQFPFEVGYIQERLVSMAKDDNWGNLSQIRMWGGAQFKEIINRALAADEEGLATGAGGARTALKRFESLDVTVASKAERDAIISGQNDWYDPLVTGTVDRDNVTTYDSVVKSAGTLVTANGVITDELLRDTPNTIHKQSGGFPSVGITGEDTMTQIEGQFNNQTMYNLLGETMIQVGVNGIESFKGHPVGMHVTSVYNIPYIVAKDSPSYATDTAELPRIIFLDTSDPEGQGKPRIALEILEPVTYREFGSNSPGFPFGTGKFSEEGLYTILGDLRARHFSAHGKIRDIKK